MGVVCGEGCGRVSDGVDMVPVVRRDEGGVVRWSGVSSGRVTSGLVPLQEYSMCSIEVSVGCGFHPNTVPHRTLMHSLPPVVTPLIALEV